MKKDNYNKVGAFSTRVAIPDTSGMASSAKEPVPVTVSGEIYAPEGSQDTHVLYRIIPDSAQKEGNEAMLRQQNEVVFAVLEKQFRRAGFLPEVQPFQTKEDKKPWERWVKLPAQLNSKGTDTKSLIMQAVLAAGTPSSEIKAEHATGGKITLRKL